MEKPTQMMGFLGVVLVLQIVCYAVIALDVPVARQVICFIYLTFVPGLALLRILGLDKLDVVEKVLFSGGLSLAFLMFLGLLMNEVYYLVVSDSLSTLLVISTISIAIFALCAISSYVKRTFSISLRLSKKSLLIVALLFSLLIMSSTGALLMSSFRNNILLLVVIVEISGLFTIAALSEKIVSPKLYPLLLFVIALSLLYHVSLISPYPYGFDINQEYYVFQLTQNNSHWDSVIPHVDLRTQTYNSMLSVTIMPTIYSRFLNMEGIWIFKIVYPLIYSMTPLGLYQFYKRQMSRKTAFLAVFFFMAYMDFYAGMIALSRQMVAELFFVLLLLLPVLSKEISPWRRKALFVVFSAALVVSHYSTSYIYLFFIFIAWIFPFLFRMKVGKITATQVAFFSAIALMWYVYVSTSAPFNALVKVFNNISNNIFIELFNPATREPLVLAGLGLSGIINSPWHQIGRIVYYLTQFFIIIGVAKLITKLREVNLSLEYIAMSIASVFIIVMCIVLPFFSAALRVERIFHMTLIFLAPFCITGAEVVFNFIAKLNVWARNAFHVSLIHARIDFGSFLLVFIIVFYFLVNVGFIYEVAGDIPSSIALSSHRMNKVTLYQYIILEKEVVAAQWLSSYDDHSSQVYSDYFSKDHVLTSYGLFPTERTQILSLLRIEETTMGESSYVFLRQLNVVDGIMIGWNESWNTTDIFPYVEEFDKIYSNGGCEIYKH